MGRIKMCRECGEILYCQKCGARQTPESPDWEQLNVHLTSEQKEQLIQDAKAAGLSISEYVRRQLENDKEKN